MKFYKFEPIYKERVWGGNRFRDFLKRDLPSNHNIGESWDVVDRNCEQSIVSEGDEKGMTLRELLMEKSDYVIGPGWEVEKPFPLLVKWLDCSKRLSLQVHPPKKIASSLKGEPKTENWYVASCQPDSGLFVGLKKGVKRATFEKGLNENSIEKYCHWINSSEGDSILVNSGSIHAIDAGNLILEIQQNSDTTYRVFDWGRVGLDGKPRKLHVNESLKCIDFNDYEPNALGTNFSDVKQPLVDSDLFCITKYNLKPNQTLILKKEKEQCSIISVVKGEIDIGEEKLKLGQNCLIPFEEACEIKSDVHASVLVTDNFHYPKSPSSMLSC